MWPPRQVALKDYRVLLLDTHPMAPTAQAIRQALDRLGGRLERAGVRVVRSHPRLPDLADVARAYARLLMSFTAAFWPQQLFEQSRAAAASIPAEDRTLGAELARGIGLSHRDWVAADNARAMHQQQFRSLFEQVDVVLCPAMWDEPFGLVAAEAQAAGTPVVAYRRGALAEVIVDGETGFLVDEGDVEAAAVAVHEALLLGRAACRRHAETRLDIGDMVRRLERVYASVTARVGVGHG